MGTGNAFQKNEEGKTSHEDFETTRAPTPPRLNNQLINMRRTSNTHLNVSCMSCFTVRQSLGSSNPSRKHQSRYSILYQIDQVLTQTIHDHISWNGQSFQKLYISPPNTLWNWPYPGPDHPGPSFLELVILAEPHISLSNPWSNWPCPGPDHPIWFS